MIREKPQERWSTTLQSSFSSRLSRELGEPVFKLLTLANQPNLDDSSTFDKAAAVILIFLLFMAGPRVHQFGRYYFSFILPQVIDEEDAVSYSAELLATSTKNAKRVARSLSFEQKLSLLSSP